MSSFVFHWQLGRVPVVSVTEPAILRSFSCESRGLYDTRRVTFVVSLLIHALLIALLVASFRSVAVHRHELRQHVIGIVTDIGPYILAPSALKAGGRRWRRPRQTGSSVPGRRASLFSRTTGISRSGNPQRRPEVANRANSDRAARNPLVAAQE